MKLTSAQMLIAAAMCEARKVELNHDSTEDEIEAADFIFNAGIFYLGHEGCDIAAEQFRAMAAGRAALENRARLSLKYGVPLVLILAGGYQVGKWLGWW